MIEKITVHKYKHEFRDEWETFVAESNNGTMFHRQAFLEYHKPGKFDFFHLMFRKGDELISVLPGGLTDNGSVFWSPVGASYGSFVTKDIAFETALELVDCLLEYSKGKFKELYLIPPPFNYNEVYNQHIEYAMMYRRFGFEYHYISHSIDLDNGKNYFEQFDKKAKKIIEKIRREKKIHIKESDDYEAFYPILVENKAKHGVKPTHTLEDLIKLKELLPENLKLFMIYQDESPIAGALMFLTNKKVALCFYIMMLYEYRYLKPIFLGIDEVTKWAVENGYKWMDIGVSQDTSSDDPMTPALDLIYFKERFHARGILRTTFHYVF